jgi:thiamine biosynthesis lipoprotein ApbE
LDSDVGAVIGGFEPAVGTVLRVWLVMEAAVGERPTEALVEEQEEEGDLDALG